MDDDFDIEKFTKYLGLSHPELTEGIEGTSEAKEFDADDFEKNLVNNYPKLAEEICDFDEKVVRRERDNVVSKKQQERDRQVRLEAMMTEGRSLTEKQEGTFHDRILEIQGPMELLAKAVKNMKRLEIRTRSAVRMDRIFEGIPTTFDEHFNIMMKDATETVLHGSGIFTEYSYVEWTNTPDGAAKQFRREWFQGDGMVRRKNLPIEYNP